jgi:chromosome segregation and condensation protein ScpB
MNTDADPPATAQQLGESYAAVVGAKDWQIDEVPETAPESQSPDTTPSPHHPTTSKPPLAEPVNEPTVPPTPVQIVEALLFVGGPPLTAEHAAEAIRGLTAEQFRECIDMLNRVYRVQNRPYAVEHGPTGYVLRVGPRYSGVREKLFGGPREARLTQQAIDVLSLIAYRQPVGKAEVDAARGFDSAAILRQLLRLGLIATESGRDSGEALFGTTTRFLEVFRLRDLADLPELGELKRVG